MKLLTTGNATSASSSAMRTSRRVSATFSSVTRPRPRRPCTAAARRSVSLSNIVQGCGGAALYSPRVTHYKDRVDNAPTIVLILILLVAADRDRLLRRHRSGDAVGQSLPHPPSRQPGRTSARCCSRSCWHEPDRWLGANLVISGARERRRHHGGHAAGAAHRRGVGAAAHDDRADGRHDRVLRAHAEDLRGRALPKAWRWARRISTWCCCGSARRWSGSATISRRASCAWSGVTRRIARHAGAVDR